MKKIFILLLLSFVSASAINLSGNWHSSSQNNNNGTILTENETLSMNSNGTFKLILFVSAQNGNHYLKNLKIEASGIWKERNNILIFVIKHFYVNNPTKIKGINQQSLNNIVSSFRSRYEKDTIIINKMREHINGFSIKNSKGRETSYHR